jgi:4-oxalocrotonate tautomerase
MHLMAGRSAEQKSRVAAAMTEAITRSLGVKAESVRILITEHGGDGFFVAGQTMAERQARQQEQQA